MKKEIKLVMTAMQSSCCGGGFRIKLSGFKGYKKSYYKCSVCGKACDIELADGGKKIIKTLENK